MERWWKLMASQSLQYTKISELDATTTVNNDSVLVINVGNATKKITYAKLQELMLATISQTVSELNTTVGQLSLNVSNLTSRVNSCEGDISTLGTNLGNLSRSVSELSSTVSSLSNTVSTLSSNLTALTTRVTDVEGTVSNIITAGFNLIGTETQSENAERSTEENGK